MPTPDGADDILPGDVAWFCGIVVCVSEDGKTVLLRLHGSPLSYTGLKLDTACVQRVERPPDDVI
jgi:hypothetical protein